MNVYLQIDKGPHSGRRIDLKSGQVASFGSSEYSDFCFDQDVAMSSQHFQLAIQRTGCRFQLLDTESPCQVNGEDVSESDLLDGDVIKAGQTAFQVRIEGEVIAEESSEESVHGADAYDKGPVDPVELCEFIGLGEIAVELAGESVDRPQLLDSLITGQHYDDAIRMQAHLLPNPLAVQWAAEVIGLLDLADVSPADKDAIETTNGWLKEPTEENRWAAEKCAQDVQFSGMCGALAAAVFFSGGSISPPELGNEIEADSRTTGQAVAVVMTYAIETRVFEEQGEFCVKILEMGAGLSG
ncbi:MAG: FHA domain-containing protein [Pirellulaceae bacterium]|nr:FHA domain-containing protein [Pirellulaceae bacterium]